MPYAATIAITEFWAKCKAAFAPKSHTHPYAASPSTGGNAAATNAFLFGYVNSTSTATDFTATVEGLTALYDGVAVMLHNGIVTSASGFVLNVNNLGDKPVYSNLATGNDITPTAPTRDTTIFNINYTMLFVYDSQLEGGAWICYRGYDSNTNTIGYQLRTNSGNRPMSDAAYRYRLYFTSADGSKWVPANTSTSTDATTSRTLNTRAIDPFGPIVYNSTNGTTNSGSRPAVATLWQQYALTIGYSYVKSLTAWDSVWLKCQPNADGSAVMKDIVQALPSSKDGYIYILLGMAYSATAIELRAEHPVYWHDGTGIRLWTGAEPSSSSVSYTTQAVSIPVSAWSGTTATVSASAVTASNDVIIAPAPASIAAWAAAGVYCSAQGAGTLTFTCTTAPTAALTANVMAFEGGTAVVSGYSITNNASTYVSVDKSNAEEGETVSVTNLAVNTATTIYVGTTNGGHEVASMTNTSSKTGGYTWPVGEAKTFVMPDGDVYITVFM